MYAAGGRASIPPEWLLKGSLLMALYSVRSERLFCELLGYNMLFRWFLGMDMSEAPFDRSTFSKNRERLMKHEVAQEFFRRVNGLPGSHRAAGVGAGDGARDVSMAGEITGIPARTLRRWHSWWTEAFPTSAAWTQLRALRTATARGDGASRSLPKRAEAVIGVDASSELAVKSWRPLQHG